MEREDVTRLVSRLRSGDRTAFDALLGLTYQELRQLARSHLRHERSDHTLNPTALVHEVWMRLSQQRDHSFDNRAHFFGAVSHAMRRVLVDHARGRRARKRRGERVPLTAVDEGITAPPSVDDVIAVDAALDALSMLNERLLRVVECPSSLASRFTRRLAPWVYRTPRCPRTGGLPGRGSSLRKASCTRSVAASVCPGRSRRRRLRAMRRSSP